MTEKGNNRYDATLKIQNSSDASGIDEQIVYIVQVSIQNVSRGDAGTYVCVGHNGDEEIIGFTKKFGLQVEFAPGKASCENTSSSDQSTGKVILQCTAKQGSQTGKIQCYQNGMLVTQKTHVYEHGTIIKESLWIDRAYSAFCCSVAHTENKKCSECNDYIWPGVNNHTNPQISCNSHETNPGSPPAQTQSTVQQTTSLIHDNTTVPMKQMEQNITDCKTCDYTNIHKKFLITIPFSCIFFITTLIFLALLLRCKHKQKGYNATQIEMQGSPNDRATQPQEAQPLNQLT